MLRTSMALMLMWSSAATAAPLDEARRSFDALDYERCVEQLRDDDASAEVEQRVARLFTLALCEYPLGRVSEALEHLSAAAALDPHAALPTYTSPKLRKAHADSVERVRAARAPEHERVVAAEAVASPPVDAPVKVVMVPEARKPEVVAAPLEHPLKRHAGALALTGAAVSAAGVGLGFGLSAHGNEQRAHATEFQSEAATFSRRAQTEATVANVAFISAGAAAVGALVTFLARAL